MDAFHLLLRFGEKKIGKFHSAKRNILVILVCYKLFWSAHRSKWLACHREKVRNGMIFWRVRHRVSSLWFVAFRCRFLVAAVSIARTGFALTAAAYNLFARKLIPSIRFPDETALATSVALFLLFR